LTRALISHPIHVISSQKAGEVKQFMVCVCGGGGMHVCLQIADRYCLLLFKVYVLLVRTSLRAYSCGVTPAESA
jgi:hypothetical protein